MPHLWNDILVVTLEELVPDYYTYDSLKKAYQRAEKRGYGIRRVQKGGKYRQLLIDFDSLPNEIKEAMGDPRKIDHILERFYRTDKQAVIFFQSFQFEDLCYLNSDIQIKYITNASMFMALRDLRAAREQEIIGKGFRPKGIFNTLCHDAITFQPYLKKLHDVQHSLPENPRRFQYNYEKFHAEGYESLISKKHKNTNSLKVDEHVIALLNDMFADKVAKPNSVRVYEQYDAFLSAYIEVINQETGELYNPKEYPKLSENTVRGWLNAWDNRIATHTVRSGNRQVLMHKYKTSHSLIQPKYAGSIISIDDRQPPFVYSDNKRAWMYMGIDLASEAWTVWVHGTTKEGMIIDFYRQMVRNYHEWGFNLPDGLEAESSLNSNFKSSFLMEGNMFQNVRIEANNARGKRVERYFSDIRYRQEKDYEGWLGRPHALSESNQLGPVKQMVSFNAIIEMAMSNIEEWNNMPHSKHPDMTRWEYFYQNQNPDLKPTNYKGILPYLGYKTQTSVNVGEIRFQNSLWLLGDNGKIHLGENLIKVMKRVEGEKVDVYWLDDNEGNVMKALVYIGDQYICEALPKPAYNRAKIEQTPEDLVNRELMSSYVATITAFQKRQVKSLNTTIILGEKPKTLNNKFRINNPIIDTNEFDYSAFEETKPEILPEIEEDEFEYAYVETSSSIDKEMIDRF